MLLATFALACLITQAVSAPMSLSGVVALTSGKTLPCVARSLDGRTSWPCRIRFSRFDGHSGKISGEVTWTTLRSIHVVEGELHGGRLKFTETRAIRRGDAELNVSYDLQLGARSAVGGWTDRRGRSRGPMSITLSP